MSFDSGAVVLARYASSGAVGLAEVVGYYDRPTYRLKRSDGTTFVWVADLCESVTRKEEREYWQDRVHYAERVGSVYTRRVSNMLTQLLDEVGGLDNISVEAAQLYDSINRELGTLAEDDHVRP